MNEYYCRSKGDDDDDDVVAAHMFWLLTSPQAGFLIVANSSIVFVLCFSCVQGADKERKGPDGLIAFEAAESDAIKALLK